MFVQYLLPILISYSYIDIIYIEHWKMIINDKYAKKKSPIYYHTENHSILTVN